MERMDKMATDVKKLVSEITLEEKASLLGGADFWHTKAVDRLGIPKFMMSDGPHGLRKQDEEGDHLGINDSIKAVCFPAACATASSFDTEMIGKMGEAIGDECLAVSKGAGKPCIIDLNQRLSFDFMLQAGYLRMELTTLSSPEY